MTQMSHQPLSHATNKLIKFSTKMTKSEIKISLLFYSESLLILLHIFTKFFPNLLIKTKIIKNHTHVHFFLNWNKVEIKLSY